MNDFLIQLQAILDSEKSKGNIDKSLTRIQNNLNKLKVQAEIDPKALLKIANQLKNALSNPKINLSNISIDSSSSIKQAEQIGQKIGQTISKSTEKNINVDKLNADIKNLTNNLNNFSTKNVGFDTFKTDIKGVEVSLDSLISKLSTVDNTADFKTLQSQANALKSAFTEIAKVNEIQLSMSSQGKTDYNWQVDEEIKKLKNLGFTEEEVAQQVKVLTDAHTELQRVISSNEFDSIEIKNKAIIESDKERTLALNQVKNAYKELKTDASQYYNLNKQTRLSTDIQNWLSKNSRAAKDAKESLNAYYRELSNGRVSVDRLNYIEQELKSIDATQRGLGKLGKNLKDQFKEAGASFTQWLSVSSAVMLFVSKVRNAITELKEVNSIMTEISKTADQLSKVDLTNVEKSSYDTASKYGKKASDYLTGIQEMYRAGYENAEDLAELSTLAQAAGDMQSDLANDYLIATDAAYKLKGSTEALNAILDGQNYITNRNALSMKDLAEATKIAASQSASSGVAVDKATAAMGTMIATTRQGGDIAARAWKGILMNIQQVEGEVEDGEILDAESLSKYEKACEALGVSLKEVKNGVISLRDPMKILEELSKAYTALDESDARRANLISAVGGKYRGNQLNALLENWDLYEKMLKDYAEGSGSAMEEAMKSANNWEGSMNRLGNTFTKIMRNIVNSDAVITVTDSFNGFLTVIDKVTSKLGSLGTIGAGAGLFAGFKNVGEPKMFGFNFLF